MKTLTLSLLVSIVAFVSGCAHFQAGSNVNAGRRAFLIGNNEAALAHFQSAAQRDPKLVYGTALRQSIWSYVGRTEYATGQLNQAQKSLERALSANREEDVARLYLGLTLARAGDRQRGLKEIEGGMRGIHDWLEYVTEAHRFSYGQFWDPRRELRSAIQTDLAMISGRDLDWQRLISNGEWLGRRIEEEIDLARRDESREWSRDGDDGGGEEP